MPSETKVRVLEVDFGGQKAVMPRANTAAASGVDSSDASGDASVISSNTAFWRRFAIRNVVTAILLNQPGKAAGVSKSLNLSHALMNAS